MAPPLIPYLAGCATFAAAVLFARLLYPPAEAASSSVLTTSLAVEDELQREMLAELVRLREAVEMRPNGPRVAETVRTSAVSPESAASAPTKTFEERLDRLILTLERHLERAVVAGSARTIRELEEPRPTDFEALRRFFAQYPEVENDEGASQARASQELFGLEPRDIFRRFGAATYAGMNEGGMQWTYELPSPDGEEERELYVFFADGLVIRVDID